MMKEFIGIGSTVEFLEMDTGEISQKTICGRENGEKRPRNIFEQAVWGARVGDCVKVDNEESYLVKILSIENPVGVHTFLKYDYQNGIETKLVDKAWVMPFPFARKIYVGSCSKHICDIKVKEWARVKARFFNRNGYKDYAVCVCKRCKVCVIDAKPYEVEDIQDFYKVFDLNDGERLNKKVIISLSEALLAKWRLLEIQGGTFTGR